MATYVLTLSDAQANLETVGGKGMSLARLAQAGLPVPAGFHITTEAYRQFVAQNGLQSGIEDALRDLILDDPVLLDRASGEIGALFAASPIPAEIVDAITAAYAPMDTVPVAVRSSATAEDLPDASFAGQQETYLNIVGRSAVLEAVKKCWASLWTARAIAYRARQGIDPGEVALAVVVQKLVFADASGVLFTANPINGSRDEAMITAVWGLGEALVSGAVTPDTLVIAKAKQKVLRRETAQKLLMTVRTTGGTRDEAVPTSQQTRAVLSNAKAAELTRMGQKIEALYGMPMDIEWTLAQGRYAIVQARPITSLPEAPLTWTVPGYKSFLARGSFAEFLPDPSTPLFATLALPLAQEASQAMMRDYTSIKQEDSYVIKPVNGYVYIGMHFTLPLIFGYLWATITMTPKIMRDANARWKAAREAYARVDTDWKDRDVKQLSPGELLAGARALFSATAVYYTVLQSGVIPAASFSEILFARFYNSLVKKTGDPAPETLLFGLDNHALRAEKCLYDIALWVKQQPSLAEAFQACPAQVLWLEMQSEAEDSPWRSLRERFTAYLRDYGAVLYDLDFAKPLPADDPVPLLDAVKALISGAGRNPYERQQFAIEQREEAVERIAARLGAWKRKWFLKLLRWAQDTAPYREDGIALMGLGYPTLRRLLGELGRRLTGAGVIATADDVYWLEAQELDGLAESMSGGVTLDDHAARVEERKQRWQVFRRAQPPTTIPEASFFSRMLVHDNPHGTSTIKGIGASAGKVTARACVLLGPEDFHQLQPGDVIIAVTTTPAWTPLFARASAVVTDIGGPLSHSSIVAREYGIPAVMATGSGTRLIKSGQIITVDGGAGLVMLPQSN